MLDSHCHLADEAFEPDLAEVVERARASGISELLCVLESSDDDEHERFGRVQALWPGSPTAVGVHPHRAGPFSADPESAARLTSSRVRGGATVRAIGEIGLDYHYDFAPREAQRAVFAAQVRLARVLSLPVIIHTREADADTFDVLEREGGGELRGVFHCFSGDRTIAVRAVALGFHVSFSGIVTFPKAERVRAAALEVPLDRLLVETDCPYLAPVPVRGKRNEPAFVRHVLNALASLRQMSAAELDLAVTRNFDRLFGSAR